MRRLFHAVLDTIDHKVFVSHCGSYSVERLYALDNYCRGTSKRRAFVVCSLLLLPAFFVSVAIEIIPLQKPGDGWRANHGCWIRLYFSSFFVVFGANLQTAAIIPELGLSIGRMACASIGAASVNIAMAIAIAALWVFPTPFSVVVNAIPLAITYVMFLILIVGPSRLARGSSLRHQVVRRMSMVAVEAMPLIVYPLFSIAYYRLPRPYKSSFVLLLPVIKIAMQHAVTWAMRDLEEYLSSNVVFFVGVFNALYMSECIQSDGSTVIYGAIIALDAFQSAQTYCRLRKRMAEIRSLAHECGCDSLFEHNLLSELMQLSQEPGVLQPGDHRVSVRLRSSVKPQWSHQSSDILNQLVKDQFQPLNTQKCLTALVPIISGAQIHPSPIGPAFPVTSSPIARKKDILLKALQMLFECEYFVLMAIVRSGIPMIYAMYLTIVGYLPSAEYYPETRGKTIVQVELMVLNIVVYAWIEVLSFLVMQLLIRRSSSLSPIHLLAFVIENQAQEMLGQLFVWYVILLQFTLVHFGELYVVACLVQWMSLSQCACSRRCGLFASVWLVKARTLSSLIVKTVYLAKKSARKIRLLLTAGMHSQHPNCC